MMLFFLREGRPHDFCEPPRLAGQGAAPPDGWGHPPDLPSERPGAEERYRFSLAG